MKTLFALSLFIISSAHAFVWEAGLREMFLTDQSYTFNSDSSSRIRRELFDRGYKRIALQPRVSYQGDEKSLFFLPRVKSSFSDLGVMNTRVSQADGKMTLKPIIYTSPDLGEARPIERIRPLKPELALTSYGQIFSQYSQVARTNEVHRLTVGSGLVHLMAQKSLLPRFEILLKGIRKSLGPKTELLLEVVGEEDFNALASALSHDFPLAALVDGLSVVLDPDLYFPKGQVDIEAIKRIRLELELMVPGMPIHLARVVMAGCGELYVAGAEFYCKNSDYDSRAQLSRFTDFKKAMLSLEKEGHIFKTIEVMESNTEFEPMKPDRRYPFYNPQFNDPLQYELPKPPQTVGRAYPVEANPDLKNACIYYDKNDLPPTVDRVGDIHSVMLQSVLGSFKNWRVSRNRLKTFATGQIAGCDAVFYLATNFSQELPTGFTEELAVASKTIPVVWFNYKFPQFTQALKNINQDPGFDAGTLIQADTTPSPTNVDPGFFRFFDYKGETFFKLSEWNPASNNFSASPELHLITIKTPSQVEILSLSRHSKTNASIPYAVRNKNIFYIADSPFSFVHYEDRFFIFTDILWDILKEKAPTERIALARIEDVGPNLDMTALRWAMDYLFSEEVSFTLGVIPYMSDIIGSGGPEHKPIYLPITKYPGLVAQLKYAQNRGASIIMHGTAHSVGSLISGYDGLSGGDYEFWLYPENRPLPFDSIDWVTRRLELGIKVFQDMGIKPVAFEVPHYAASVMNYVVFSKFFKWNYHRTIYFPYSINADTSLPDHLMGFECDPKVCGDERRSVLANLRVEADYTAFGGMTLPFITHKDAYGQALIPETLGMVDFAFYDPKTWRPVSRPEDILRRARKLKVIRGAVASFFWHPQLLNSKSRYYVEVPGSYESIGGKKSLQIIVEGLKEMGYVFKSIQDQEYFPNENLL